MAVPFYLPNSSVEDHITAVLVILNHHRQRCNDNRELRECLDTLVMLLMEEIQNRSEYDTHLRQILILLRNSINQFNNIATTPSPPAATASQSYRIPIDCCHHRHHHLNDDETDKEICKDSTSTRQDILSGGTVKVDEDITVSSSSLISRPLPRMTSTFWMSLAVIPLLCIVGWHLLFPSSSCM